jgi:hypothetical protein
MTGRKPVTLNLGVGTLTLYPNQMFEFKSSGPHSGVADSVSIAPSSIGDIRSQYIDNDRAKKVSSGLNSHSKDNKIASLLKNENSPP